MVHTMCQILGEATT